MRVQGIPCKDKAALTLDLISTVLAESAMPRQVYGLVGGRWVGRIVLRPQHLMAMVSLAGLFSVSLMMLLKIPCQLHSYS